MAKHPSNPLPSPTPATEPVPATKPRPTIGRILHLNIANSVDVNPEWRPCVVTRVWSDTTVNVVVTLDGVNDAYLVRDFPGLHVSADGMHACATSVLEGVGPRDWRWPPRE